LLSPINAYRVTTLQRNHYCSGVSGLIDSGWAAWLPDELAEAYASLNTNAAGRRAFAKRLAAPPDAAARERWERFRLVAPSRVDLPETAEGLTGSECFAILEQLGLVDGDPPKAVEPEPVELVLTLDHEQVRELENVRMARTPGEPATTPIEALPSLDQRFGGADIGRNDPCPCGSGKKYKRCHGR
jgi:hypothetical protein